MLKKNLQTVYFRKEATALEAWKPYTPKVVNVFDNGVTVMEYLDGSMPKLRTIGDLSQMVEISQTIKHAGDTPIAGAFTLWEVVEQKRLRVARRCLERGSDMRFYDLFYIWEKFVSLMGELGQSKMCHGDLRQENLLSNSVGRFLWLIRMSTR